ncbi:MAG TPA: amylo-alpha-1,6-glucosidase [Pyrinomonadaceae bacterium]|jgi:predicted glycogen debranching enzyme
MINFAADVCRDLHASTRREWLETNGLGGFASSTLSGMNTRRYHALLTAAVRPPTERFVLLSKLEETLRIGDKPYGLSTNRYPPEVVHPQGYLLQTGFRLDPFPVFTYRVEDLELEKTVFMVHGENTIVIRYRLVSTTKPHPSTVEHPTSSTGLHASVNRGRRVELEIRPLVAFRDYHSLRRENPREFLPLEIKPGLIRVVAAAAQTSSGESVVGSSKQSNNYALFLAHDTARVFGENVWYKNFLLTEEQARGFDFQEDLYNPCTLIFELRSGQSVHIIASTEPHAADEAAAFEARERERRARIVIDESDAEESVDDGDDYIRALRLAAEQFIVRRGENLHTVIAGYHWFTDWGRDTMIALPGLTLATARFDTAREILLAFAEHLNEGMIPNRFSDAGDRPEYNTVDATLWFVHAVGELLRRTGDEGFVREHFYERLKEIILWHERGTRYDIRVDTEDGLLRAGNADVQLTWMDAKIGGHVVTPRTGKPVEIQALWYNALRTVEEMAARFRDEATRNHARAAADGLRASFNGLFWNEDARCLYDYIDERGKPDASMRPNQIFAVSLPHALVTGRRAFQIVEAVRRALLTPYGLRSLAPDDPDYLGRYEGDGRTRDTAYHRGTVWAWLMGAFVTAYLRVNNRTPESLDAARGMLARFSEHLHDAGVGQISEIFDGDEPHTPRGCIAQAWSVAELLRCELEELV